MSYRSLGFWPFKPDDIVCGSDSVWNPILQQCSRGLTSAIKCEEDFVWDPDYQTCRPDQLVKVHVSDVTGECPSGYEHDTGGFCKEKSGFFGWLGRATNTLSAPLTLPGGTVAPAGSTVTSDGAVVSPEGTPLAPPGTVKSDFSWPLFLGFWGVVGLGAYYVWGK
jgi:hypothetical protein